MNLETTAKGIAILAVTGVGLFMLWRGKQAIEAVAQKANDAVDVAFKPRATEAPAANPLSRVVDAAVTGTQRDEAGKLEARSSLGTALYGFFNPTEAAALCRAGVKEHC